MAVEGKIFTPDTQSTTGIPRPSGASLNVEDQGSLPTVYGKDRFPGRGRSGPHVVYAMTTPPEELVPVPDLAKTPEREAQKKKIGCVVRSLTSALGAEAMESEWQDRFDQFDDTGPYKDFRANHPNLTETQEKFLKGQEIAYADANVASLFEKFKKHDSPMGAALRDKEIEEYGRQDAAGIHELLDSGRTVTIIGSIESGRHMIHVTKDAKGRLIAQSDEGAKVITLDGTYTTIAFADKDSERLELAAKNPELASDLPHLNETIRYEEAA